MTLKSISRVLFSLLLLLTLLHGAAAQKSAADYWPMQTGNVWKFSAQAGNAKIFLTMKVVSVTKSGGAKIATLAQYAQGREVFREVYRITPEAIYRIHSGKQTLNPALPLVKFPAHDGDSWDWQGKFHANDQDNEAVATATVSGPVTVKTATGTYRAMKIHFMMTLEMNGQRMELPNDYYLAPGVGLVRQVAHLGATLIDGKLISVKLKK